MISDEDLNKSLYTLKSGNILLYPTDTIWGLGCDATNTAAVEKIFRIKGRKETKSLIILVNGITMLERFVTEVPPMAYQLIGVTDKPITIIYPRGKNLAEGVCSEDGSIGIRICDEPFCNELISRFRKPVISTSANITGNPSPSHFGEIDEKIIKSADYIVKYRQDDRQKSTPSSVISIDNNGVIKVIRP